MQRIENQYAAGFLSKEEYQKLKDAKKSDVEFKDADKTEKFSKSEKEYLDLTSNLMQMIFDKKIKGFEVKRSASGKLKITIK